MLSVGYTDLCVLKGIDLIHNPEFTTCEFYRAYTDLDGLIRLTEDLILGLTEHVRKQSIGRPSALSPPNLESDVPFQRLDFVSELEKVLKHPLPKLTEPAAHERMIQLFANHVLPMPPNPSLPQLLDKLSAYFLEPQCTKPTFIVHHPECMSPLSKSFEHPHIEGQRVAARAELFVKGQELANMYEEENSPLEQRRKFEEQLQYRIGSTGYDMDIDEQYLDALTWGMPPVGGWGCGIERLCMILTGANRIGDVLSFGTLRNVVAKSPSTL